jgi:hypothetical protein
LLEVKTLSGEDADGGADTSIVGTYSSKLTIFSEPAEMYNAPPSAAALLS